jgi:RNA polymerase sigma-70 factor (ECF subfamily)
MPGIDIQAMWGAVHMADDQQSFRELFNHFYPGLVQFAMDLGISREAAEEIVADVFIWLWKNRKNEPISHLKTYLFTAVRNRCYNHHRDNARHQWLELTTDEWPVHSEAHPQLEWKEMQQWLNRAIEGLPPQARTIFRLVREEGFKYKEVAAILDISPRTVETQLVRATSRLRAALHQYGQGFDEKMPVR